MMQSRLVSVFLALSLVAACRGSGAPVGGAASSASAPSGGAAPALATQPVTVVGENYCLGCTQKKEQGAVAQCIVHGHRHALRVESASGDGGRALPELAGATLHYLDNDQSAPLQKTESLHHRRVEVTGRLFGPERTLQVERLRPL
ncbi:MAG: hypothetical protein IT376_13550 [Polyangiaceae bacterium]|nr:hypothetical protein [Polyangiaceae bacterium]